MTEEREEGKEVSRPSQGLTPEAMRALAEDEQGMERVRANICEQILQKGFEQIEATGFENDPEMERDWKEYKAEVEAFFRSASPDDPLFRQKLREMTARFARGGGLNNNNGE
ncbi:hypothetical protein HOP50_20g86080 [Chloropicon primus]|uniref:Uncharacterized protein n=1 Tax=Chloropicon primus TaxID=1764295 RepID=A0A5B8MZG6_9CHLO|nr:hypothetical protein A3770_20p85750 [Chloropicon primus]UPR05258.1 hypothetical protein HOP50_20g86080 [Chloropicon primus]|mmetsp:Transcript_13586/g.38208  ORF Transcript_13586/g.38208 Transcript_13586/m.38208 type:complete len:112 (+) Transcript_13586:1462-1797(+)|eukprot:QDZ26057.1 hypothetical protein A3770_20p85750 [Chloropicon primus]